MSASRNDTPWNSPMGRPNCWRSRLYDAARSSAAWASPVAAAAMPSRPESSAESAMDMPCPGLPTIRPASPSAPSKLTWRTVSQERPILRSGAPNEMPSVSAGITKQDSPLLGGSPVGTEGVQHAACPAWEIHALVPFTRYVEPSASGVARVEIADTSEPAWGPDRQEAPSWHPPR